MATRVWTVFLILSFAAPVLHAAEGRIPIFKATTLDSTGGASSISGKYILVGNISVSSGSAIALIGNGNDDVEIDLNGFALEAATGSGPVIRATGIRSLVLRDGIVRQNEASEHAVQIDTSGTVGVRNLSITGGLRGLSLDVIQTSFSILRNTVTDSASDGIFIQGDPSSPCEGSVENNFVVDVGGRGVHARFSITSITLRENRVESPGTFGVTSNTGGATVLEGNRINSAGSRGLIASFTQACRVSGNVVQGSGRVTGAADGDGIYINGNAKQQNAENCLVLNNVSTANKGSGIRVLGDRNHLEGNVFNRNELSGIFFETTAEGNTFKGNTARGNLSNAGTCAAQACAGLTAPDFCDDGTGNTSFTDNLAPDGPC